MDALREIEVVHLSLLGTSVAIYSSSGMAVEIGGIHTVQWQHGDRNSFGTS